MDKADLRDTILAAKSAKGMSWSDLAEAIGRAPVYTASACLGENSMEAEDAGKLCETLGLDDEAAVALQTPPYKGRGMTETVPRDPLIYRFYEIMTVYGESIKEVVHEQFGDGIMSAIDFTLEIDKQQDPKGDRVVVTMNGKFLPYRRW